MLGCSNQIIWYIMKRLKPLLYEIKQKLDKTTNVTRENLTGVRVVRAFNKQNYETEKFKNSNYNLITTQLKQLYKKEKISRIYKRNNKRYQSKLYHFRS